MFALYLDENCSDAALVKTLGNKGVNALTVLNANMTGKSDEAQLIFAASRGRCLVTADADFFAIHHRWVTKKRSHSGIIVFRAASFSVGELARRLARVTSELTADEMKDRLEHLSNW